MPCWKPRWLEVVKNQKSNNFGGYEENTVDQSIRLQNTSVIGDTIYRISSTHDATACTSIQQQTAGNIHRHVSVDRIVVGFPSDRAVTLKISFVLCKIFQQNDALLNGRIGISAHPIGGGDISISDPLLSPIKHGKI